MHELNMCMRHLQADCQSSEEHSAEEKYESKSYSQPMKMSIGSVRSYCNCMTTEIEEMYARIYEWILVKTPISYLLVVCQSKWMRGFMQNCRSPFYGGRFCSLRLSLLAFLSLSRINWNSTLVCCLKKPWKDDKSLIISFKSFVPSTLINHLCGLLMVSCIIFIIQWKKGIIIGKHWFFDNTWDSENKKGRKKKVTQHIIYFLESAENDSGLRDLDISIML